MRARLSFQLVAITLAAVAAAWFWALAPMTASLLYIHPSGWTDADLVRHLWHFRLIQPEWISSPPHYDYLRWTQAETLARLAGVFIAWLGGAAWILRRHLRRRTLSPPNQAAAPNRRPRFTFLAWFKLDHIFCAQRPLPAPVGEPQRWATRQL